MSTIEARGYDVALQESKGLPERKFSLYLTNLMLETGYPDGPISSQFIANPEAEATVGEYEGGPQEEHLYTVPGVQSMIYKYRGTYNEDGSVRDHGRVLWTISHVCDAYCRYCFRGETVGGELAKPISETEITAGIDFLQRSPEINEIILSGGEPLFTPRKRLERIVSELRALQYRDELDFIRIHTRLPVTNPESMYGWRMELIEKMNNPDIVMQINHPAEITDELRAVTNQMRRRGAILSSQSVLLRGINDDVDTLMELFTKLRKAGIRPYYVHQIDPVSWAKRFEVPIEEAKKLAINLRSRISGMTGTAKIVYDAPHGRGKVPLSEGTWNDDNKSFLDFDENEIIIP